VDKAMPANNAEGERVSTASTSALLISAISPTSAVTPQPRDKRILMIGMGAHTVIVHVLIPLKEKRGTLIPTRGRSWPSMSPTMVLAGSLQK